MTKKLLMVDDNFFDIKDLSNKLINQLKDENLDIEIKIITSSCSLLEELDNLNDKVREQMYITLDFQMPVIGDCWCKYFTEDEKEKMKYESDFHGFYLMDYIIKHYKIKKIAFLSNHDLDNVLKYPPAAKYIRNVDHLDMFFEKGYLFDHLLSFKRFLDINQ